MAPITKNIRVVDENGKEYEATYPRRAKGLVKNGRARFVDEGCICLVRPPNKYLEDNKLLNSEDINTGINAEENQPTEEKAPETAFSGGVPDDSKENAKPTMGYVLSQIENIRIDTAHITSALDELKSIQPAGPGDMANAEKAEAISDIVKCRETTNQKLLAFYEKVYDDLKEELVASSLDELRHLAPKQTGSEDDVSKTLELLKTIVWNEFPEDLRSRMQTALVNRLQPPALFFNG